MKKTKQEGVYFVWSASILVCMLLAVFTLGFTSCKKAEPTSSVPPAAENLLPKDPEVPAEGDDTPTPPDQGTQPTDNGEARLGETPDMGQEYVDKFVFLGDSTTYGLGHYEAVNKNQVWTPASGTLTLYHWNTATIVYPEDDTEISIVDAVTKKQPEYMLITLGVNGVSTMEEKYFIEVYTALVQAIQEASPDTKIILNSIYPATARYPSSTGITNEKITAANTWIERIAGFLDVKYLDSASVLKDENGNLPDSLDNGGDGLHMNGDGYQKVVEYIRTHGYQ